MNLEVEHVRKSFDQLLVLQDITFTAQTGEIVGLLGRNGVGKTTLLRMMAGIYRPDQGRILYDGQDVYTVPQVRTQIFFTDPQAWPQHYTPLMYRELLRRIYPSFRPERFMGYVKRFELPPKMRLSSFSQGMKGLFFLSLALSLGSRVLLLDEPTEGLDPIYKKEALRLLVEAAAEDRPLMIIATHRLDELESMADRLLFLRQTRVEAEITLEDLPQRFTKWRVFLPEGQTAEELAKLKLPQLHILSQMDRMVTVLWEGDGSEGEKALRVAGAVAWEKLPLHLEDVFAAKLGGMEDE
ncbi:MAG: ABC transporter ATP-binding protein [Clostridiales bacterium]|nr:ABC transporter ATP-binding protein [Clostridiales bacterium]